MLVNAHYYKFFLQGNIPDNEPDVTNEEAIINAKNIWASAKSSSSIYVDTTVFTPPIQLKAVIVKHEYNSIEIRILVRYVFKAFISQILIKLRNFKN